MKRFCALALGLLAAASASADILYTRNTETSSRANGGAAGFLTGAPADPARTLFDDVPIPIARLGANTSIDVTRVTVGIRRIANAPATDVLLYSSTLTTTVTAPDTNLDTPPVLRGTQSLAAAGAASLTELVVFGDGVNTLFNVPLNFDIFTPANTFGAFALGVSLSNADNNNGWRITSGPDANAQTLFWLYDPGHTAQVNDEGAYNFGSVPSSFYIIVEGTPVPEPASLALLALGGLALGRRR